MGQREEDIVRAFIDAQAEGDVERALGYLANDADYRIPAWKESLKDLDAIRSALERDQTTLTDMRTEVVNVASTDRMVFSERIDSQYINDIGRDTQVHIVGVYELGPDGKIVSEREYFDMKEIEAQIGGNVTMAIMDAVAERYEALDAGDFDRVVAVFTPMGTYQDPTPAVLLAAKLSEGTTASAEGGSRTGSARW